MTFIKRVNNSDTGDSTHWGGDHMDTLDKYLDNTDIEPTTGKPAKIMTKTWFHDGKLIISNGTNTYTIKTGTLSAGDVNLTLPSLAANATLMSTGGSNTFTASQTFTHQLLKLLNPAATFSYIFNGSAIVANRNITIPLLTADDELVTKAFAQTLTTKTINVDSNTIKHSTTNAEGDILIYDSASGKYIRLAGGTDGQVLTRVSSDTAWADATGGGSGGSSDNIPTVGTTVTGSWFGTGAAIGTGVWSSYLTNTSSVTPLDCFDASFGASFELKMGMGYFTTNTGEKAGFRTNDEHFQRSHNPELFVRYKIDPNPNNAYRVAIGFTNAITANHGVDNALNGRHGFLWYKEAADTNVQVGRNDGDGTTDKDATVSLAATNTSIHTIRLFAESSVPRWGISKDGAAATYFTTEIPSGLERLGCIVHFESSDNNDRTFFIFGAYFKATII